MQHHYIPKFYTKQWAGADGKLVQFFRPLPHLKIVAKAKPPSGVGWEENLYALDLSDPLQQWLEKNFFLEADQLANDALQILLTDNVDLPPKLRTGWSRFIMSLLSRTPQRIALLKEMYQAEFKKVAAKVAAAYDEEHSVDPIPPTPAQKAKDIAAGNELALGRLIQRVMDLPQVGYHLNNMDWAILKTEAGFNSFLTSDYPVHRAMSLHLPASYIDLPISPHQLFVAANRRSTLEALAVVPTKELIKIVNIRMVQRAVKYVYADDESQISCVEKYLK